MTPLTRGWMGYLRMNAKGGLCVHHRVDHYRNYANSLKRTQTFKCVDFEVELGV